MQITIQNPFKKKEQPPAPYTAIHQHDIGGFHLRLDDANKNKKGPAVLQVYRQKRFADKGYSVHLGTLDGKEAADQPSFEGWLMSLFGDGFYKVTIMNRDNRSHGDFFFAIGNPKEEKEEKEKTKTESATSTTVVSGLMDIVKTVMAGQMAGGNGDRYEKSLDRMDKQFDRMLGFVSTGQDPYEQAERLISISKALAPQIQPEDSSMALLTTLATGLMNMSRGGNVGEFTPAQIAQINQLLAQHGISLNLAAAKPNALPPGVQQQVAAAAPTTQPQQFVLSTGPTQTQPQTTLSGAVGTSQPQATPAGNTDHQLFYTMYIEKLRRSVAAGESDQDVAKKMVDMLEYAMDFQRADPHPQVAGLIKSLAMNPLGIKDEFIKFFESLPELAGKKDRQDAIIERMTEIYLGGEDGQDQPTAGSDPDDDEGDES